MATEVSYNGTGAQTTFNITYPYITSTDVKVSVGGTTQSTSAYTINASSQVVFNSAPASGTSNVRLFRVTDITQASATYTAGSAISAQDLNDNQLQVLYSSSIVIKTSDLVISNQLSNISDCFLFKAKVLNL